MAIHKERIEYIDLAKGICIILVVLNHTCGEQAGSFIASMNIFRMPLYFVLSGLFFKHYDFVIFFKKKVNKLLIPFFCAILFVVLPSELLLNWISKGEFVPYSFQGEYGRLNLGIIPAAWFLMCLFIVNIYFYCLMMLCKRNVIAISIVGGACGVVGYALDYYGIYLPMWLDSSLTALPFFIIGYLTKNNSNMLHDKFTYKHIIILLLALVVLLASYCFDKSQTAEITILFVYNIFNVNIWSLYIGGVAGTFFVLILSKYLTHIPFVSFVGRYSIVVLLTHQLYIFIICNILYQLGIPHDSLEATLGIFVTIMALSIPTIKFCIKYLPYCFAQKDLWRIHN